MAAQTPIATNYPALTAPMVDRDGKITQGWRIFFQALWVRTGAAPGLLVQQAIDDAAAAMAEATLAFNAATTALAAANASLKKVQNLADLADVPTARNNLGLTALATAAAVLGWADPTGTGSRLSFDMDYLPPVSNPPTTGDVTLIRNQLFAIQKALGQLILDQKTVGTIGT